MMNRVAEPSARSHRNNLPLKGEARGVPFLRLKRESTALPAALQVRDASDCLKALAFLKDEEVELFVVLMLDSQSRVRGIAKVSSGLVNCALVHPREVFRYAIAFGAVGIIIAHNHPTGDPTPSAEDRAVTRQLVEAGRIIDIPVYDHIIVAGDRFTSFANAGLL